MLDAILLLGSTQALGSDSYSDDLQCAAAMLVVANPKSNPQADEDERMGAQLAFQFYLGRLTTKADDKDWISLAMEKAMTIELRDAFRLAVPCFGRKAQLLVGAKIPSRN